MDSLKGETRLSHIICCDEIPHSCECSVYKNIFIMDWMYVFCFNTFSIQYCLGETNDILDFVFIVNYPIHIQGQCINSLLEQQRRNQESSRCYLDVPEAFLCLFLTEQRFPGLLGGFHKTGICVDGNIACYVKSPWEYWSIGCGWGKYCDDGSAPSD